MQKVTLKREMETLLITLYSKAQMSKTNQIICDKKAEQVLSLLDYDFKKLGVNKKTQVFMALRSAIIDNFTTSFIGENPSSTILHLGCGLDFRASRISLGNAQWYDLDYPDVIQLKKQFCTEDEHYHFLSSSVTELTWLEQVPSTSQPVLVIAEGLTMYLSAKEIDALFSALLKKFPHVTLVFDVYSLMSVKLSRMRLNGLLNRTGAEIKWGIDNPKELETLGISYKQSLYLNDPQLVSTINSGYFRSMFRFTMNSKIVNDAMRILVYETTAQNSRS